MVIAGGGRTPKEHFPAIKSFNGAGDGDRRRARSQETHHGPWYSLQRSRRW